MSRGTQRPRFFRRLHVRIGAVALALLILMALGLLVMSRLQQQSLHLEATQRLNLGLAKYIVEHQPGPLLNDRGEPNRALMDAMAMYVMRANPSVEVYLLDSQGRIVAHALDDATVGLMAVDLVPVRELLRSVEFAALPVLGDDPRAPGVRKVFSVAPVGVAAGGETIGYLYVVLQGQAAQGLADWTRSSGATLETSVAVALACVIGGAALLVSLAVLTRPLRRLTAEVQAFRGEAMAEFELDPHEDEIAVLRSAVHAMQARINEQFTQMEESDRMRRELVSNLSHDLNTPLTSIQGYAELCLLENERMPAHERAQHLRLLLRHTTTLSRRVSDLFELSKLDAGRMRPKLEVFCLAELLQDVIQGYQWQASERGLELSLDARDVETASVRADIALMERVFQNLIDNALRHTPEGGKIVVTVTPEDGRLRVSVLDSGVGIASEHLPHIFERYYRAWDAADVTDGPSAGLGLAIVKRILDLHGSVIQVTSAVANGTRFDFSLQRAA